MMTYGAPMNLQVEMVVRKIVPLTDTTAILFSGSVPDGENLIARTRAKILTARSSIQETVTAAVSSYQEMKRHRVEDLILRPLLGVDFVGFQSMISQSSSSQILQQTLGMVSQHNMQLDILIAGFDEGEAHLTALANPGIALPMDIIGSAAIGSGGLHANVRLSLGKQVRVISFPDTVYNVYGAKVAAEVAPGVGKMTDMAVIRQSGIKFFDETAFRTLESISQDRPALRQAGVDQLAELCRGYTDEPAKPA
jgi:20S proteasome alpha/beta subunit